MCKNVHKYGMGKVLDHWIHYTFESCRRDTINYIRYSLVVFFFFYIFESMTYMGKRGCFEKPWSTRLSSLPLNFTLRRCCKPKLLSPAALWPNKDTDGEPQLLLWSCFHCVGDVIEFTLLSSRLGLKKNHLRKNYAHTTLLSVSVRSSAKR